MSIFFAGGLWGRDLLYNLQPDRFLEDHSFGEGKSNTFLLCKGSMPNVFASAMASQMSRGRRAYQLFMGRKPDASDLIDIFDPAGIGEIGTIREQRDFYERWLASVGG